MRTVGIQFACLDNILVRKFAGAMISWILQDVVQKYNKMCKIHMDGSFPSCMWVWVELFHNCAAQHTIVRHQFYRHSHARDGKIGLYVPTSNACSFTTWCSPFKAQDWFRASETDYNLQPLLISVKNCPAILKNYLYMKLRWQNKQYQHIIISITLIWNWLWAPT